MSAGTRRYGITPVSVYRRQGWEFQAFLSGQCRMVDGEGHSHEVESPSLWVFHPEFAHGWISEDTSETLTAVVHFLGIPHLVEQAVAPKGFLQVFPSYEGLKQMQETIGELSQEVWKPRPLSFLKYRILRDRLSLLFLQELPAMHLAETARTREEQIVHAATALYCMHMNEGLRIADLAERTGYSSVHLRQLFQKVHGKSPKQMMREYQMERAAELLENTGLSGLQVALECGFSSQSLFCRAFKQYYGISPRDYSSSRRFRATKGDPETRSRKDRPAGSGM